MRGHGQRPTTGSRFWSEYSSISIRAMSWRAVSGRAVRRQPPVVRLQLQRVEGMQRRAVAKHREQRVDAETTTAAAATPTSRPATSRLVIF